MTETNRSTSVPVQGTSWQTQPAPTAWVGWIAFAGTMMLLLGTFHVIQGLVALFQQEYYLVGANGLTVKLDYTQWGWTHVILGVLILSAGIGLIAGQMWARVVAVIFAFASAIVNIGFIAAYAVWSTIMIAIDVLVIWAVTVHGSEMKSVDA